MRIFKKIFKGNSEKKRNADNSTISKDVSNLILSIGLSIITASNNCDKAIQPLINSKNDKEKQELYIYVFYEFVYFFLHLTLRESFSKLKSQQLQKLQIYLGPKIVETVVDAFFKHWPEDLKSKISSDFYKNLNNAEIEYSKSKELYSEKNPLTSESLFSKLARNVAELCGSSMNPVTIFSVLSVSLEEFKGMKLDQLISKASKVV